MADTTFVNATSALPGTLVVASWLNDVNTNTYTQLAAVAGTNTITANGASTVTVGYPRGVAFRFLPINTNTGPCTINISGLGVRNITKFGTAPLVAGDLIQGSWAYLTYDGTQFQLINAGGPLTGVDTYVTTAGSTTAYTLNFTGSFAFVSGYAVKLIFNATNTTTTPTLNVNGSGAVAMKVMDANGNKIDPIVGAFAANTPATAIYDGVNWNVVVEYPTGRLLNIQTPPLGASVYTPTPGTTSIVIKAVGAGGAGGGNQAAAAAQYAAGGAGGSGAYFEHRLTSGFSGAALTVGTGGVGVSAAAGGAGGNTSFAAIVAGGGGGGGGGTATGTGTVRAGLTAGGAAGAVTGVPNLIAAAGSVGGTAWSDALAIVAGIGAPSFFGGMSGEIYNGPGVVGSAFGAGGSGSASTTGFGARAGGNGANGLMQIYEYS